jgi:hypothetical protein
MRPHLVKHALLTLAALTIFPALADAQQQQSGPPPTWESTIARSWKGTHDKLLTMAKDFPEELLGKRPHPDSRNALEEFRHVTIGLEMTTALLKGEKFDYMARTKADEGKPATRASIVAEMEAAYKASMEIVQASPKPLLIGWSEHQGEHYGKLVTLYRMNGLVPPISRPKTPASGGSD